MPCDGAITVGSTRQAVHTQSHGAAALAFKRSHTQVARHQPSSLRIGEGVGYLGGGIRVASKLPERVPHSSAVCTPQQLIARHPCKGQRLGAARLFKSSSEHCARRPSVRLVGWMISVIFDDCCVRPTLTASPVIDTHPCYARIEPNFGVTALRGEVEGAHSSRRRPMIAGGCAPPTQRQRIASSQHSAAAQRAGAAARSPVEPPWRASPIVAVCCACHALLVLERSWCEGTPGARQPAGPVAVREWSRDGTP
eukprot:scaffold75662_cov31-Tisochrysis_lutea.AAC.1